MLDMKYDPMDHTFWGTDSYAYDPDTMEEIPGYAFDSRAFKIRRKLVTKGLLGNYKKGKS